MMTWPPRMKTVPPPIPDTSLASSVLAEISMRPRLETALTATRGPVGLTAGSVGTAWVPPVTLTTWTLPLGAVRELFVTRISPPTTDSVRPWGTERGVAVLRS